MDDEQQLNQEEEQNSSEEKATSGAQQVGRQVADKATDMAKETVKKGVKQAAKAVGQAVVHAVTSVVAALGPWLIPIILVVVILFFAIAYWGVIAEIPGKIKDAFTGFVDNIAGIFSFDDSTGSYNISTDQLDKIIQDLKDSDINIEDYDLSKKDLQTFLEADLITQTVDGISVGGKKGAIQIYMTDPTNETETLGTRKLNYMPYSQFNKALEDANNGEDTGSELLNSYTVDTANNILVVAKNESWTKEDGTETSHTISYSTKSFGYKTVTAQYQMPFMFFIDLCMTSSNKDYVLAVAEQVKNTQIIITVQNTRTETYEKTTKTEESSDTNTTGDTVTVESMSISDSLTPIVTKADTLLYTKEMVYTNKVEKTEEGSSWTSVNKYSPGIDKETYIKVDEFGKTAKSTSYSNGEAYNGLITGGDMLFEILSQDVNNETIEQTLKYILYKLSGVNFGVTSLDESLFDFNDFSSFDLISGGIGYSSINITDEDLEILYKITSAERGDGTKEQQEHVVSVILNRVLCQNSTVRDVVFAKNQFEPTRNGMYEAAVPSETTKEAVHYVIQNGDTTGGATYFCTPAASQNNEWYRKSIENGTLVFLFNDAGGIPNSHNFYSYAEDLAKLEKYKRVTGGSSLILAKAAELFKKICTSGIYTSYGSSSVPCKGPQIDCSSFVSWVLYECGYEEFKGGQHTTENFKNTDWSKTHPDWQQIPVQSGYNPVDILQPGDIFVRYGKGTHHMLIVAYIQNGQLYAYDCGTVVNGTNGDPLNKTYFLTKVGDGKIIRIKSKVTGGTIINPNGQYLVVLDAGHGEKPAGAHTNSNGWYEANGIKYYTSGTSGRYNGKTYNEYQWNKEVADRAAEILSQNSKISIMRIGYTDETPTEPNGDRVPKAVQAGASLYISVHFNSNKSSATNGTWVYVSKGDTTSKNFGQILSSAISKSLGTKNGGVNADQNWTIVKNSKDTGFPGAIAEGAFMSNAGDMKIMVENNGIEKYAQGIANAVLEYLAL